MQLYDQTIHQLAAGLRKKEYSALDLFDSVWKRMEQTEPQQKEKDHGQR